MTRERKDIKIDGRSRLVEACCTSRQSLLVEGEAVSLVLPRRAAAALQMNGAAAAVAAAAVAVAVAGRLESMVVWPHVEAAAAEA